jgi:DNA-binding transcriptional regulator YbjK
MARMSDRRTELADAAVALVAAEGFKGLTHRAVDRAAGVPLGTTSNYWRTRDALTDAVVDRFEERDLAVLAPPDAAVPPSDPAELARLLAEALADLAGRQAELTRARMVLALARPDAVAAAHGRLLALAENLIVAAGVDDAATRARRVADYCDGLLFHALTTRQGEEIDVDDVAAAIGALLGAGPAVR